jgi:hypothetical protein
MWPATKVTFFDLVFRTGGTFDYKTSGGQQYVDYGNWNLDMYADQIIRRSFARAQPEQTACG